MASRLSTSASKRPGQPPHQLQAQPQAGANKRQRYWPGKVPAGGGGGGEPSASSSDDEESDDDRAAEKKVKRIVSVRIQQANVPPAAPAPALEARRVPEGPPAPVDLALDRRLRRLHAADQGDDEDNSEVDRSARRERILMSRRKELEEASSSSAEGEDDEGIARRRRRERALDQQTDEQEVVSAEEEEEVDAQESESSEEESSEEEADEFTHRRLMFKPVFIAKEHRETINEKERQAKEQAAEEDRLAKELEARRAESRKLVQDRKQKELNEEAEARRVPEVDDTDDIDEEAELEAWKLRELMRIKRDKEERIARERELEELERVRHLPERERAREAELRRQEAEKNRPEKGKYAFLQRYHHRGAFFMDKGEEIYKRDVSAPTVDEVHHRELLPKVLQVKRFGRAGQTKYTHLADQDTSRKDAPWSRPHDPLVRKAVQKMAGVKNDFNRPSSSKRH